MTISVKKGGLLTTIQDLGRYGSTRFGINPNGAMDRTAARLLNVILNNDENEPVFEFHFPAEKLRFDDTAVFAVGGADFGAELDGQAVKSWCPRYAPSGSELIFRRKTTGNRQYMAVAGGLDVDRWLGSSSTNLVAGIGGLEGRRLRTGDRVELKLDPQDIEIKRIAIAPSLLPRYSDRPTVRIIAGAETEFLTEESRKKLFSDRFRISANSNRMGFRLEGAPLELGHEQSLVSAPVTFGTIQLLPDGGSIILMADHQTSGGYPRIGHVIDMDIPLVAQLGAGDSVGFELVTYAEAERLSIAFERDIRILRAAVRLGDTMGKKL